MCLAQLHVGGLVAVGLDPTGQYLLTVSHSGRGVYDTRTWKRVARDVELAYPTDGRAVGIGPIAGIRVRVSEIDYDTSTLNNVPLGHGLSAFYAEGVATVSPTGT